jgi:hypothetical protein
MDADPFVGLPRGHFRVILADNGEKIACTTCLFRVEQPGSRDGSRYGQCRRGAPAVSMSNERRQTRWPVTRPGDWCGEHLVEVGDV